MSKSSIKYLKFDPVTIKFNRNQKLRKYCRVGFSSVTLFLGAFLFDGQNHRVVHADDNNNVNQPLSSAADTYVSSSASNLSVASEQSSESEITANSSESISFGSLTASSAAGDEYDSNVKYLSSVTNDINSSTSDEQDSVSSLRFDNAKDSSSTTSLNSPSLDGDSSYDGDYVPKAVASYSLSNVALNPVDVNLSKINSISLQNTGNWFNVFHPRAYNSKTVDLIEKLQGQKSKLFSELKNTQNLVLRLKTALKNSSDASSIFQNLSVYNDFMRQSRECNNQIQKINKRIHILQK